MLKFQSVGTAPQANLPPVAFLDGVSVAAPEPGVWTMLLTGFAAVDAVLRRRQLAA